jgi:hypothetical protein
MGCFSIVEDPAGWTWQIKGGTDDCVTVWKLGDTVPQSPGREPGNWIFGDGVYEGHRNQWEDDAAPRTILAVIARGVLCAFEPVLPAVADIPVNVPPDLMGEWWQWTLRQRHGCLLMDPSWWSVLDWGKLKVLEEEVRLKRDAGINEKYFTDRLAWCGARTIRARLREPGIMRFLLDTDPEFHAKWEREFYTTPHGKASLEAEKIRKVLDVLRGKAWWGDQYANHANLTVSEKEQIIALHRLALEIRG